MKESALREEAWGSPFGVYVEVTLEASGFACLLVSLSTQKREEEQRKEEKTERHVSVRSEGLFGWGGASQCSCAEGREEAGRRELGWLFTEKQMRKEEERNRMKRIRGSRRKSERARPVHRCLQLRSRAQARAEFSSQRKLAEFSFSLSFLLLPENTSRAVA